MGIFNWRPFQKKTAEQDALRELILAGGGRSSGRGIGWQRALQVSAVLACVRVICQGVAQVPLKLFQEDAAGRARLPAKYHPLYDVLKRKPNPWQTAFEYREMLMLHLLLAGNHYSFVNRVGGKVRELIPFEPGDVTPKRAADRTLTYQVRLSGGATQTFPAEAIWHVRGLSWDGWRGLDAINLARSVLGLTISADESQEKIYANGLRNRGLYSVEGKLTAEQYKNLRQWIEDNYTGPDNEQRVMLLDNGAKFFSTSMTGADAQQLESRRYQVEEVCRMFGVMPFKIGYSDKAATYASSEQQALAHVIDCLMPWYVRLEQSIDCHLLTDLDAASGLYSKHVVQGLLRGSMKDTADFLSRMILCGVMVRNEARDLLEFNPIEGLDEPLTPVNMQIGTDATGDADATQTS